MKLRTTYSDTKKFLSIGHETVEVKPFQIVVWVGLTLDHPSESIPQFPAILDTGNNHNFAISLYQFVHWAKLNPDSVHKRKAARVNGVKIPMIKGRIWLHTDSDPFELASDEGIGLFPVGGPRLPILGLRALTRSKLQIRIDGNTRRVLIRTPPPWYWPF